MIESALLSNLHEVKVLRLDAIHPVTGGNKHFKLKYNLHEAMVKKIPVITIGGAFSNHIAATAAACAQSGIRCIGLIRGERTENLNNTLLRARLQGMELRFVSRSEYAQLRDPENLQSSYPEYYCIPEGGSNEAGIRGCEEILNGIEDAFDVIICPCGTGATAAGIARSLPKKTKLIGINVLRTGTEHENQIRKWIPDDKQSRFNMIHDFHFGGYARNSDELNAFVEHFNLQNSFAIEPIYTGRMFFAIEHLLSMGTLKKDLRILAIHTGGLQYLYP